MVDFPSFRYLQVFEAVARYENVSRASVEVNLSQPAVTQAVIKIEEWIGRKLFERSSTGTFLLREGRLLQGQILQLFQEVEGALSARLFKGASPESLRSVIIRLKESHIKLLAAASGNGSLDDAMQLLGQSRSTVWRTARDIEYILDRRLFDRNANGLVARPEVRELAVLLNRACRELQEVVEQISPLADNLYGRLFIGAHRLAHSSLLASTINDVLEAYPNTAIKIVEGTRRHLLAELRGGQIDLMFGPLDRQSRSADLVEEALLYDPYCVVGRRDHPLSQVLELDVRDLAAQDWVLPGGASQRSRAFAKLFAAASEQPRSVITVTALNTQISIMESSNRLTLLPRHELALEPQLSGLAALPFPNEIPRPFDGLTMRLKGQFNPAQIWFRDKLRERLDRLDLLIKPATAPTANSDYTDPPAPAD